LLESYIISTFDSSNNSNGYSLKKPEFGLKPGNPCYGNYHVAHRQNPEITKAPVFFSIMNTAFLGIRKFTFLEESGLIYRIPEEFWTGYYRHNQRLLDGARIHYDHAGWLL